MTMGTFITGALLIIAVILVVRKLIKDRKEGKNTCSCGCSGCAFKDTCHKKEKEI